MITTMKCIWLHCAFLSILKVPSSETVCVLVDQFVVLPCEMRSCAALKWSKIHPIQTTVAECVNKICSVKEGYQERFRFTNQTNQGNYSLLLNPTKYNDRGAYKCTCGSINKDVILEVIVSRPMSVDESSNITLPCYADTQTHVNDVTWLHNSIIILHYMKNGSTFPGEGYENRISLTEGGFKHGDLSLTLTSVQQTDAGLYRCFVQYESTKGDPHAYMIHVDMNGEHQKSNTDSIDRGNITTTFILIIVGILVVGLLTGDGGKVRTIPRAQK
ncbi:hypothetical protein E1301_Tti023961 [Triplophysa tibetana]|uniref:Ig-like domain-containing protein n=1 Tax=Triplophysa tibetana TaxID=1572043 RepID=A0A5A9NDR6_9TELE|nr:hypothetical protein E1301_Tti009559 [Triplophysa tibetana]KAA0708134.1 hypothetical protein E1301_Tti023961 [Triplophysa tibetana]